MADLSHGVSGLVGQTTQRVRRIAPGIAQLAGRETHSRGFAITTPWPDDRGRVETARRTSIGGAAVESCELRVPLIGLTSAVTAQAPSDPESEEQLLLGPGLVATSAREFDHSLDGLLATVSKQATLEVIPAESVKPR